MRSLKIGFPILLLLFSFTPALVAQESTEGEGLLDEAVELKLSASTPREFDEIADLCEEAIDKGLEEESLETARQLWASACFEHADLLSEQVFTPRPDRRWKFLRQQALERLEKSVELVPEKTDAWMLIARFNLLEGGDEDAVTQAIEKTLEYSEDNPKQRAMALIFRAQTNDDMDERRADIEEALSIDPSNSLALRVRGRMYVEEEEFEKAIDDFAALAEAEENNTLELILLARTLRDDEEEDMALTAITRAIEINPDVPMAFSLRGEIYLAQDKDEEALADVSRAIELNPRDSDALMVRANVLYSQEEYEEALRDIEKVLTLQQGNVRAYYLRSFVYAAMEDYEPAIEDMQMLVNEIPDEPAFQNSLAMLYNSADQPDKAIRIYNRLLRDDPEDERALRGRGDARLSTGEHEQAIADYEAALAIDDADDGVLNNLAWVLATSTFDELRDGQRAVELALKACELTEYGEAHILSTLAAAYAESGDFETAIEWSEKSVEMADPGRQADDLAKELATLKRGEPIRENEGDDKDEEDSEESSDDEDTDPTEDDDAEEDEDDDKDDDDGTENKLKKKDDGLLS
ncbi:MAG: tetratricopeptide repeat protein [Pirellulaceae bacterium]